MSLDNVAGIAGNEQSPAPVSDTAVHTAGGDGPLSIRDAARSVIDWRRKSAAGEAAKSPNDQSNLGQDASAQSTQSAASLDPTTQSDPAQAGDDAGGESLPGETQSQDAVVDPRIKSGEQPPIEPPRSWSKEDKETVQGPPSRNARTPCRS